MSFEKKKEIIFNRFDLIRFYQRYFFPFGLMVITILVFNLKTIKKNLKNERKKNV